MAGEDADPGEATGKATSKLLAKDAVAAGEGILGRNAGTVLTRQYWEVLQVLVVVSTGWQYWKDSSKGSRKWRIG